MRLLYRGINKSDIIVNNNIKAVSQESRDIIQTMWTQFQTYYQGATVPTTFPALKIGYQESQAGSTLLYNMFSQKNIPFDYFLPICNKGENLGYFTGVLH
jgi:hypothetical protein|nr:hypothetical protein [uncultured Flavobacterium sp.]